MFVQVILEGKNEIGSGTAEPFLEAMLYHRKFMKESKSEIANLWSVFPCIHIIVFGFAGSVLTHKLQSDILVPIIPLFGHSTDLHLQLMAARALGALKIAIEKLTDLYSCHIPTVESKNQSPGYPYPRSYINSTSTNGIQEFSGALPNLSPIITLPGGWNMVVMDALDIDHDNFPQQPGSYRQLSEMAVVDRQPLKDDITSLIQDLHAAGYVHGDLQDANFIVKNPKDFMLLDFDWAGLEHNTHYPIRVNWKDIRRPNDARDGNKITTEHDLEMLKLIFDPDHDDRNLFSAPGDCEKFKTTLSMTIGTEPMNQDSQSDL
ncbi:uncharacterized protein F5147DRAFT_743279 [Suillus discolor]|uniref:Protein kinase domain-containing protein n=1 Tax=Suillus discolor TaxID=1912936 RepID=A0A9P7JYV4_9AGAM|nr:uncharacterized protein F5147DRAFT_743279 [Suillus discolor]KAG2116707.1 hypothetical protein F5147DRAFT_743279 [Suillus discolor]